MRKKLFLLILSCLTTLGLSAQGRWFNDKDLTLTGVYYYPEHWDESEWDRDFKKMHDLGFEFTHFAEFAWTFMEPEEGKFFTKGDKVLIICRLSATRYLAGNNPWPQIL